MFQLINEIITQFRKSFKRQKTWQWFVCIVLGFMIRKDYRGVTSTITALRLKPGLYHTLLHFFRSSAYKVIELYQKWIEVVLKHAPLSKPKRGRPRLYGKKVRLFKLFSERSAEFTPKTMVLYGKPTKLQYLCVDLLWRPAKRKVRFVLVRIGNTPFVLMSSDLTLTAEEIITLYGNRFKIETGFDDLKNDMGGFAYHFWTKALPKRKRNQETQTPTDPKSQEKVRKAIQATEVFVCLNVIASGILTIISFRHSREIWNRYPGYIKTVRSPIPTVATTKLTLSQDFCAFLPMLKGLIAFKFIPKLQRVVDFLYQIA